MTASNELSEAIDAAYQAVIADEEREHDLEELLKEMHAELVGWVPPEVAQHWADRMENLGVYADWGWSQ